MILLAGLVWGLRARRWAIAGAFGCIVAFLVLRAIAGMGSSPGATAARVFAADRPPTLLVAEFAGRAVVDALSLALSSVEGAGRAGRAPAPNPYAFQGRLDGRWQPLPIGSARADPVDRGRQVLTVALAEPTSMEGIRILRKRTPGDPAPGIEELTLRDGRPYVWVWAWND